MFVFLFISIPFLTHNAGSGYLRPGVTPEWPILQSRRPSFGHGMIMIPGPAADANRANYLAIYLQWNPASEDHDLAIV